MKQNSSYLEQFPDSFSIRHKITPETEKKRLHLHEQLELVVAVSDNLSCQYETGQMKIPAGSILLLDSLSPHYIYKNDSEEPADRYVLYFSYGYVSGLSLPELNLLQCFYRNRSPLPGIVSLEAEDRPQCYAMLEEMIESDTARLRLPARSSHSRACEMETRFLLGRFLVRLNRLFSGKEDSVISDISSDEVSRILNIKDYIQETYSESLRVEDIAHRFFISKTQLYRLFHSVLGISVGDYILQVRMIRAKDLLRNSDFSVERIAEEVGYQNLSAFSRAFKANVGISPHAFRKNNT